MATIFIEGFDKYGIPDTTTFGAFGVPVINQGGWSSVSAFGSITIVAGLSPNSFALKQSIGTIGNILTNKTLPNNYARLIGGIRFNSPLAASFGVVFLDAASSQLTLAVNPISGTFSIMQGNFGTVLQTSTASVASNTTHYLEWDITFNVLGVSGGWTVWLDGVQILQGTGVTAQTAHNYANGFGLQLNATTFGTSVTWDDIYLFDQTTLFNNSVLLSNPSVITQFPIADHSIAFTNEGNVFGYSFSDSATSATIPANTLYLIPFKPNVNCTVTNIGIESQVTNNVVNFKGVIYADSAGVPGALLSSGNQVTGITARIPTSLPLVSSQNLTAATQYWIGFILDTTINLMEYSTQALQLGYEAANTYGSGAPGTAPSMTPNQPAIVCYGICTGALTNWQSEALNPPIGALSSVASGVATTRDLYVFPNLPTTVTQVYTVVVSGDCQLSASGAHTLDLTTSSGGTIGEGSNVGIAPTTSFAWYDSYFDVDPHTSAAWTPTNVNNGFYGMTIAS